MIIVSCTELATHQVCTMIPCERIHSLERGKNRRILVPFICGIGRLFHESFHILGLQRCGRELATHTEQFSG
jgi:hypothetical protein